MNGIELIRQFLEPRSIAIVGVPRHTGDGSNVLENLMACGYSGTIYPVNPRAREILGVKCFASVRDLPAAPEVAIIQTAPQVVPGIVADCAERGIQAVIVQSDGFAELSSRGKELQEEMLAIARAKGVRILGPNTFGVINAFQHVATPFAQFELAPTPIAAVSQSGIFSTGHLYEIQLGKVIDLGNAADVGFCEALEYLAEDVQTEVVLLHIEQVRRARRFMEIASALAKRKPMIALQGGKSREGAVLVRSHSASLAGDRAVFKAAFRQCGILQCSDLDEMRDMARAAVSLPPMRGGNIAVMTFTMGGAVMVMDACEQYGLGLAHPGEATQQEVKELLRRPEAAANPVDLMPLFQADVSLATESFKRILVKLLHDGAVDAVLFVSASLSPTMNELGHILHQCACDFPQKPVLSWVWGPGQEYMAEARKFNFPSAQSVARALNVCRSRANGQ